MKLVEILARELKEWEFPNHNCVAQEGDGEIWYGSSEMRRHGITWNCSGGDYGLDLKEKIASDWETAIITRDQWQAEKGRVEAIDEGIKAADKGNTSPIGKVMAKWRRHRGGRTPNSVTDRIDLRFRDGETSEFRCPSTIRWRHINECDDVMAWRPSILEEEKQEMAVTEMTIKVDAKDAIAAVDAEVARHVADHPFTWRDRIREIDAYMIGEKEAHKRLIESAETERAELVAKLAAEGLALCGEPIKVIEPRLDMLDPENWVDGDIVEFVVEKESQSFHRGGRYTFKYLAGDRITIERDDEGDENGWFASYYRWVSRP